MRVLVAAMLVLVGLAACTSKPPTPLPTEVASPFDGCPLSTSAKPKAGEPNALPSVMLSCFTGGSQLDLSRLGKPTVINFWSSSCGPCRKELPQLQAYANSRRGDVVVIGVITSDTREAAASLGQDLKVTFPSVFDPDGQLLKAWGRKNLPITLFVDERGHVRYEEVSGAITAKRVTEIAHAELGVSG